jgi:GntR family transcriptional regulator
MMEASQVRDLSRTLGTPLHHQLSAVIRDGIVNGRYQQGETLPPEDGLCRMFSVSRITVRRAMQSLENEGLIERRQGSGTFVRDLGRSASSHAPLASFLKPVLDIASLTKPVVKEYGFVRPPKYVRDVLRMEREEDVLRVVRLRLQGKLPILHLTVFLPQGIGRSFSSADFAATSLLHLMQRTGHVHHRVEMGCGAALADPITAKALRVTIGAPLVEIKRLAFDASGRPIEFLIALAPPDRYQVRMSFGPDPGPDFDAELVS